MSLAPVLPAGVLLVDDDAGVVRLASDALAKEGFEVVSTQSGAGALHHVNEGFRPAVLVTSIRMPGIGGIDALTQVTDIGASPVVMAPRPGMWPAGSLMLEPNAIR